MANMLQGLHSHCQLLLTHLYCDLVTPWVVKWFCVKATTSRKTGFTTCNSRSLACWCEKCGNEVYCCSVTSFLSQTLHVSTFRAALDRAAVLLKMSLGGLRIDNQWGTGGGQRPVTQLIKEVKLYEADQKTHWDQTSSLRAGLVSSVISLICVLLFSFHLFTTKIQQIRIIFAWIILVICWEA